MKDIAVQEPEFECQFGGKVQILSPPSLTFTVDGKGTYKGPMLIMVTGSSAGGAASNATGTGSIIPTGLKTDENSLKCIRQDDKGYIPVFGATASGGLTSGIEVVTVKNCKQKKMEID